MAASLASAQIVSPDVHPDRTVTFRLKMPGAKSVKVSVEGSDAVSMTRDATGLWSLTTAPLAPDIYGYGFDVDGVAVLDPNCDQIKPNLIWRGNMVLVPGETPEPWEVQHVPHGTLHHHFYKSGVIGDERDYFVYTPPNYSPKQKYPVMYLLHGYSDMANGWTEVGKAHVIMDNLIAAGKTKPMIVVMTLGYGIPDFASPIRSGFDNNRSQRNYDLFRQALIEEVIPRIQSEYSASSQPKDRAIAGLSMGGAESLYTGLNNLDKFTYIGAFSSGGLSNSFDAVFPGLNAQTANKNLKQLWISCGTEDGLITPNRTLVKWLKSKDIKLTAVETPGRHAWPACLDGVASQPGRLQPIAVSVIVSAS